MNIFARSGRGLDHGDKELSKESSAKRTTEFLQKAALVGTTRILRKVLEA